MPSASFLRAFHLPRLRLGLQRGRLGHRLGLGHRRVAAAAAAALAAAGTGEGGHCLGHGCHRRHGHGVHGRRHEGREGRHHHGHAGPQVDLEAI